MWKLKVSKHPLGFSLQVDFSIKNNKTNLPAWVGSDRREDVTLSTGAKTCKDLNNTSELMFTEREIIAMQKEKGNH